MRHAKITAIYPNKIVYKNIRRQERKTLILCVMSLILSFGLTLAVSFCGLNIAKSLKSVAGVYQDPSTPLYSDMSDLVFTSSGFTESYRAGQDVVFNLPIVSDHINVHDKQIDIEINDTLVVNSIAGGLVTKIGKLDDQTRYVEITHDIGLTSVISGLKVVGVVIGEELNGCQSIGVADCGVTITIKLFYNSEQVDIDVNGNLVVWKH